MPRAKRDTCPERLNVLLVGGGGREHALAWKMLQSPRMGELWVEQTANAELQSIGRICPEPVTKPNIFSINRWCDRQDIDLVVIGPEVPLALGIAEELASDTRVVFGVNKNAARLEADKAWAKEIMRSASIPSAEGRAFTDRGQAIEFVTARDEPCVVKASGLAAGKGVVVCDTTEEAVEAITRIMGEGGPAADANREFGDAGATIVIEQKLLGQEMSVLALVDGHTLWVLDPCQDHKQVGEGDVGPNTGGMGAYCPTPLAESSLMQQIERDILVPTVDALRREGITFRGVLYAGLMLTAGGPKVLEFNCRFGDPECQPLMSRFQGDLLEVFWATATGNLDSVEFDFDPRTACCVVVCSEGYPGPIRKDMEIFGIEDAQAEAGEGELVKVFHAGTTFDGDKNTLLSAGGRVLGVTALAADLASAQNLANRAADKIRFDGAFFRRDIGHRVLSAASKD
jgi:phosphoribosylamine--glycine ligase